MPTSNVRVNARLQEELTWHYEFVDIPSQLKTVGDEQSEPEPLWTVLRETSDSRVLRVPLFGLFFPLEPQVISIQEPPIR